MIHPLELLEPEQTVGDLWHGLASRLSPAGGTPEAGVDLAAVRGSVAVLFRALGGPAGAEIGPAPAEPPDRRRTLRERVAGAVPPVHRASWDGERLRLPPRIDAFPTAALNRAAYLWLTALAALAERPGPEADPLAADLAEIAALAAASDRAYAACPGLRAPYAALCAHLAATRPRRLLPREEAAVEALVAEQLCHGPLACACPPEAAPAAPVGPAPRGYRRYEPPPIWPRLLSPANGRAAATDEEAAQEGPQGLAVAGRKRATREDMDRANRRDSFILHRFEGILSWAESLNIARMTDDDDAENAAKAAEDQDSITLTQHFKRAASRLRVSLDLSPQDAEHERLSDALTYPEWNHRARAYMEGHVRVLEAEGVAGPASARPDPRLVARVKRQFEPLHPRRVTLNRQMDGQDIDLDAVVVRAARLAATGQGCDRVHLASRASARDLAVALLVDCSRSTESEAGARPVIDTAREAVAALAAGLDAAGDRLAVWGFSSLRRDRVFLTRCKGFDEPLSAAAQGRIAGLRPGHYTRLGAAIRHASARLAEQGAERRLLLVLTDGKPNDLDHYEGVHGIEDSRMAVREARALGQALHGVVIEPEPRDWLPRIFGKGGFTLLPDPARLPRALPDLYHALTRET